jgi:hypothetical protein
MLAYVLSIQGPLHTMQDRTTRRLTARVLQVLVPLHRASDGANGDPLLSQPHLTIIKVCKPCFGARL